MIARMTDHVPVARADQPRPPDLRSLPDAALFLDFDGTLVEIADRPDAIRVPPELPEVLDGLSRRFAGRVAIVSGRSVADIDRYLGDVHVAVSGSHGGELRLASDTEPRIWVDAPPPEAKAALARLAASREGLLLEEKPLGLALHYRAAPDAEADVLAAAGELAQRLGLGTKRGKMVIELVGRGVHKGQAVTRLMQLPAFAASTPVFVGDDITDEDGFTEANARGGGSVLVGPARDSAALWRLDGVAALSHWLQSALA